MAAKDYEIRISGLTSISYLAKISKRNPCLMLDKCEITDSEILMLVDAFMNSQYEESKCNDERICFESHIRNGKIIQIQLSDNKTVTN